MSSLIAVDLSKNSFYGTISNRFGLFPKLQQILLSNNNLTSTLPASIGNVTTLTSLYLGNNHLHGSMPLELFDLHNLQYLALAYSNLTGSIPPEIGQLTQLLELTLDFNELTGSIPDALFRCSLMQQLDLNNNKLVGGLSSLISNMSLLVEIDVSYNGLSNTIPNEIFSSVHMTSFALSYNNFNGTIPHAVSSLSSVFYFDVAFNQLTSTLPLEWNELSTLVELYLQGNFITGAFPVLTTNNLSALRLIEASNNLFSHSLPETLFNLSSLQEVYFLDNMLSGTVSKDIATMPGLRNLVLSYNQMSGSLTSYIDSALQLLGFFIDGNAFTGTISNHFVNASSIAQFAASDNFLTGSIPGELSAACFRMSTLTLAHNLLSGSLSAQFRDFHTMSALTLNDNMLSGELESFKGMPVLKMLFVQGNRFVGSLDGLFNASVHSFLTYIDASIGLHCGVKLYHWTDPRTIPLYIQSRPWSNLDLSFNRLTGDISLFIFVAAFAAVWMSFKFFAAKDMSLTMWCVRKYRLAAVWMSVFEEQSTAIDARIDRAYTVSEQYAWFVSGAYLRGETPAIIIFRRRAEEVVDTKIYPKAPLPRQVIRLVSLSFYVPSYQDGKADDRDSVAMIARAQANDMPNVLVAVPEVDSTVNYTKCNTIKLTDTGYDCLSYSASSAMIGYFLASISDETLREQHLQQIERDCQGAGDAQGYDSGLVILFAALFYAFFVFDIYGDAAGWRSATIAATVVVVVPVVVRVSKAVHNMFLRYQTTSGSGAVTTSSGGGLREKLLPPPPPGNSGVTRSALHSNIASSSKEKSTNITSSRESEIRMSNLSQTF
eukprot:gene24933-31331_t